LLRLLDSLALAIARQGALLPLLNAPIRPKHIELHWPVGNNIEALSESVFLFAGLP
tara:strand:- start:563 stop:730 length:168 start_codon:yes stop_codon:yes gene_type:complete